MKFTKEYNLTTGFTAGVRTHYTTTFYLEECLISAYRTINNKLYRIEAEVAEDILYREILHRIDKIVTIDNEMFIMLADIYDESTSE